MFPLHEQSLIGIIIGGTILPIKGLLVEGGTSQVIGTATKKVLLAPWGAKPLDP